MRRSRYARTDAAKRGVDEIMVIGGSDIFAATMPMADRLEITHVHASPEGDALFPRDRSARSGKRYRARNILPGRMTMHDFTVGDICKALKPAIIAASERVVTGLGVPYNPPN